jgi:hypothetical protein
VILPGRVLLGLWFRRVGTGAIRNHRHSHEQGQWDEDGKRGSIEGEHGFKLLGWVET